MQRVTEVRQERGTVRVALEDGEALVLLRADAREIPLTVGESIDVQALRQQLLLRQYPEALDKAVRLLAVRPRSEQEIRRSLQQKRYQDDTIDMVLCKLEKERLLDDAKFAEEWVEARSRMQYGKRRIAMELRNKGVNAETAEAALGALPQNDAELRACATKLLGRYIDQPPEKALRKTLDALLRRGYEYDAARHAVETVIQEQMAEGGE